MLCDESADPASCQVEAVVTDSQAFETYVKTHYVTARRADTENLSYNVFSVDGEDLNFTLISEKYPLLTPIGDI